MLKNLIIKVRNVLDQYGFEIEGNGDKNNSYSLSVALDELQFSVCYHCHRALEGLYIYILSRLDKAGLLPKDYQPICCNCHIALTYLGDIKCACGHYLSYAYSDEEVQDKMVNIFCPKCNKLILVDRLPDSHGFLERAGNSKSNKNIITQKEV